MGELLSRGQVHALVVLAHECVHSDDGEDQPENETNELAGGKMNIGELNFFILFGMSVLSPRTGQLGWHFRRLN